MIVIEGTDLMGKTTMAKSLWSHPRFQERGCEIQHLSRLPDGHDRCWHYVHRMNVNGIFDRFYLSEIAYANARGDAYKPFTDEHLRWVHAHAMIHGVFTVMIVAESKSVIEGRYNREEMYNLDTIWDANLEFQKLTGYADVLITQRTPSDFSTAAQIEDIVEAYFYRRGFIESL